ncbi:MAG: TldD/PmbA family protein [Bacteroidales bacterium]|nr:TldD/PmbA family protein [Bacteroidales bacterium]
MRRLKDYLDFFSVTTEMLSGLMETALSKGGEYADIFFEYSTLTSYMLKDHKVQSAGSAVDYGVGIRVIKGEQTGYAYSESTEYDKMKNAALVAAAIADNPVARKGPANITEILTERYYPEGEPVIESDKIVEYLTRMDGKTSAEASNTMIMARFSYDKSLFFNSLGEMAYDEGPMSSLVLTCVFSKGRRYESVSASRSFRKGYEMFTEQLAEELASEVIERGKTLFSAKRIKGGQMPVVMGAGGSGILLHEAIGHTFEADFNRKGISIFSEKLGQKVCSEKINVVDDGTVPFNRGSINVDDEGVPGQKTYMVKDGILNSYLHDRISARHYGVKSTGNGRRESFRYYPIPRMRATYMENGDASKEDIIRSVKKGVYVDSFSNGQVQIGAGDFTFYVKSGFMIENGRLTYPIKDVNVIGNGPEALASIVEVADDLKIDNSSWICGKEQQCPVSCGMPTVLISSLSVGGE